MEKKKNVINIITTCVVFLVGIAFILVIFLRKKIFSPDSILYNMYELEIASNIIVKLLKTLVIIDIGVLVIKLSSYIVLLGDKVKNNTTKTTLLLVGNVVKYISAIAIVLCSLSAWGIDTTAIVTGAGVLTLVIGLGCQSMVADVVAGIFILFEGDFKVGDIVVINGWRGTVQQIGIRRTRIIDAVGNVNIVNNSSISNIINNTRDLSVAAIEVGIEYNESIERVETILKDNLALIKKNIPAIVEGPFYKGVSALADSSVNIKLVAKCKEEDKYQTERDMNRQIKILFDKYNVNIPFPQVVLNYRDENEELVILSEKEKNKAHKFLKEQTKLSRNIEENNQ